MLGNIISENGSVRGNEKFGPCQVFFFYFFFFCEITETNSFS